MFAAVDLARPESKTRALSRFPSPPISMQRKSLETQVGLRRTLQVSSNGQKPCARWRERCAHCHAPILVVTRSANPVQLLLHSRGQSAGLRIHRVPMKRVWMAKKNKFVTETIVRRLRLRLEALWEELCVPWVDRDFFLVHYCLQSDQLDVRRIVDQILVLVAHRKRVVRVLELINQREKLLLWLQNHPQESSWWSQVLNELVRKSVLVVEAIQEWRSDLWRPHPFLWRQRVNYLLKMKTDLGGPGSYFGWLLSRQQGQQDGSVCGLEQAVALLRRRETNETKSTSVCRELWCQREQRAILYLHGEEPAQSQLQQELHQLAERNQFIPLLRNYQATSPTICHDGCSIGATFVHKTKPNETSEGSHGGGGGDDGFTVPSSRRPVRLAIEVGAPRPEQDDDEEQQDEEEEEELLESHRAALIIQIHWQSFRAKQRVHNSVIVLQRWWCKQLRAKHDRIQQHEQRMETFKQIWRRKRTAAVSRSSDNDKNSTSMSTSTSASTSHSCAEDYCVALHHPESTLQTLQQMEQQEQQLIVQKTLVESLPNSLDASIDYREDQVKVFL